MLESMLGSPAPPREPSQEFPGLFWAPPVGSKSHRMQSRGFTGN